MAARDVAASSSDGGQISSRARARASALSAKYRSLFVVGRGGMGSVEAALEVGGEREYQRVVALKRLLPDAARDARRVEMFMREAKLAAMLDHPNVVRAYDYGEIDGELYLAMEYVEGQPLSRVLKALREAGEKLHPSLAAYVMGEVCEGLHAAHELVGEGGQALALVHRDVSPQNVMLAYDGHVRLLDFGVAKIEAESVTKTGEVKGKTAYMSPEQAMGDPIDRRSDLFGVGAVLFECHTLARMWGDGTDMEVIRKLALEKPPRLEDAPEAMAALYTRLVAREAGERPASAGEVARELASMVPQGKDAAAKELRAILEAHFGEQAAEGRTRLRDALEQVAPEQAKELRESVAPESGAGGARAEAGAGAGAEAGAGAGASAGGMKTWLAVVAIALGGVVMWRVAGARGDSAPAPTSTPVVTSTPPAVASPSPSAQPSAAPIPTSTSTPSAAATPTPTFNGGPKPSAAPPASIRPAATKPGPSPSATTRPVTSAAPAVSVKPPDVDDHPF